MKKTKQSTPQHNTQANTNNVYAQVTYRVLG